MNINGVKKDEIIHIYNRQDGHEHPASPLVVTGFARRKLNMKLTRIYVLCADNEGIKNSWEFDTKLFSFGES